MGLCTGLTQHGISAQQKALTVFHLHYHRSAIYYQLNMLLRPVGEYSFYSNSHSICGTFPELVEESRNPMLKPSAINKRKRFRLIAFRILRKPDWKIIEGQVHTSGILDALICKLEQQRKEELRQNNSGLQSN